MQKLKDILNLPVKGGLKTIKKVLDRYIISKQEKEDIAEEIVNLEANLAPKYPRCFIWYDLGNEGDIGESFPPHYSFDNYYFFAINENFIVNNYIMFDNQLVNTYQGTIDINSFLNRHKGKYKEISLKEYMGECPEGDFGIIKIPMRCDPNGQVVHGFVEDEISKKRINYLKSNIENKYNVIRIYPVDSEDNCYYYINTKSYIIDKKDNCIIFEIDTIPPLNMATQIKVSLDAEVVKQ